MLQKIKVRLKLSDFIDTECEDSIMNKLESINKKYSIAYVRFASVYRDFQDIEDFSEEISSLTKERPKSKKTKK